MITFSCKQISQEDLVRCAFGLNKTAYNLLIFLLKKDRKYTATQIAELLNLDRTTVQKAVKDLASKGLVERSQMNLEKGGYTFFYRINGKEQIKSRILQIINDWCKRVEEAVNQL